MFPGRVRHLLVRREIYADLHRCACQCPRSGMTMFFPGQKPLPDGHGVHSFPPPPRMYVPSWQGRHWPARRGVLVERLGITCHDRPGLCAFVNESPAGSARTLFFDEAEAGAVAAEELRTPDTSSRGIQHSRLHGSSRRNDWARKGGGILSICLYTHEYMYQKTRANQRASQPVWINPIGSIVSCRPIAKTCGDAPCPLS